MVVVPIVTLYFYRWKYITFTVTQLIYSFTNKATITDRAHSANILILISCSHRRKPSCIHFKLKVPYHYSEQRYCLSQQGFD